MKANLVNISPKPKNNTQDLKSKDNLLVSSISQHSIDGNFNIYRTVLKDVTDKVKESSTAMRLSFMNSVKSYEDKYVLYSAIEFCKQFRIRNNPQDATKLLKSYRENELNNQYNHILTDNIIVDMQNYFICFAKHSNIYQQLQLDKNKYKSQIEMMMFYFTQSIPQGFSTCQPLTNWIIIKLLSSNELPDSKKNLIRIGTIGSNPQKNHCFVIIDDNPKIVIDPWIKYVKKDINNVDFNNDGYCGSLGDYIKIFNSIADGDTVEKYSNNLAISQVEPLLKSNYKTYNQQLDKL